MAEETITLPKSGLVIPRDPAQHPRWELRAGDHEFVVERTFIDGSRWYAGSCFVAGDRTRYCVGHYGTRDECLAWLDEQVMKLRAALLPQGAFVVSDSEETRETTRQAVMQAERSIVSECTCGDQGAGPCATCNNRDEIIARAVLAALKEAAR